MEQARVVLKSIVRLPPLELVCWFHEDVLMGSVVDLALGSRKGLHAFFVILYVGGSGVCRFGLGALAQAACSVLLRQRAFFSFFFLPRKWA